MNFYDNVGKIALGSRVRRLGELFAEQSPQVYALYNIEMQPKWFPVYYALSSGETKSITQIATEIGHSHPSVSTIVKEMKKAGYVETASSKDARTNYVKLSAAGIAINDKIKTQYVDLNEAIDKTLAETQHNLWKAVAEWEFLLEEKSLFKRVENEKKLRESKDVKIVPFKPEYAKAFRDLNELWISENFRMEESDYKYLDHPKENILDKGGYIFIALYNDKPVGTCAIVNMDDGRFELAKMAVAPEAKGKSIGFLLGKACIEKAREIGAKAVYLESNTKLKPAINLYHKLGFKKVIGEASPYERCNIQMELSL